MSEVTQDKDDGRIFYDTGGRPVTLYRLVRREPDWAVSRIEYYLSIHDDLLEALEAMLNKAYKQNWNDNYPEQVEQAQAAVDKARGEL